MKNDQEETADEGGREHRQKQLDEALDDTFPASDPPAVRPNRADPDPVTEGHDEGVPARSAGPSGAEEGEADNDAPVDDAPGVPGGKDGY